MGKHDNVIEWLAAQIKNATEALEYLQGGAKIEIDDEDVTPWWKEKYAQIIRQSKELIAAYKRQND